MYISADNETVHERSSPHEIVVDSHNLSHLRNLPITLQTPPSTLTVQNGKYRTAVDELEERHNPKTDRNETSQEYETLVN